MLLKGHCLQEYLVIELFKYRLGGVWIEDDLRNQRSHGRGTDIECG